VTGIATLTLEELRGVPVGRISGEIDSSNAREMARRLERAVSNQAAGLVVDLSEAGYVDSAGVQLLFDVADRLNLRGQQLRVVVAADSFVADVLATVRLEEKVELDSQVSEAVEELMSSA
jgi:anti-sigma B factor antagonist